MIYLLFRQDLRKNSIELLAPHATFDGVMEHLQREQTYWEEKMWPVERHVDCSFLVMDVFEKTPKYYYLVGSRTILK